MWRLFVDTANADKYININWTLVQCWHYPEHTCVFSHLIFTLIMQGSVLSSVFYCKHQKITLTVYKRSTRGRLLLPAKREQQRLDVLSYPKELKRIWNIYGGKKGEGWQSLVISLVWEYGAESKKAKATKIFREAYWEGESYTEREPGRFSIGAPQRCSWAQVRARRRGNSLRRGK